MTNPVRHYESPLLEPMGWATFVQLLRNWSAKICPDIIFLSQTLLETREVEDIGRKLGFSNTLGVSRVGHSGGLALFWRSYVDVSISSF